MFTKKRVITFLLIVITIITFFRIAESFMREIFIDFNAYYDGSKAILNGANPYLQENLSLNDWGDSIPIIYPAFAIVFAPYLFTEPNISKIVFLSINIFAVFLIFFIVLNLLQIKIISKFWETDVSLMRYFFFILFLNSSPVLMALRLGQITSIAVLLIFLMFKNFSWKVKSIFLAWATLLKYSLFPVLGLMILSKKKFKLAIFSIIIFIVISFTPVFFGHNLVEIYRNYADLLIKGMTGNGVNSFVTSGQDLLTFSFFRIEQINFYGKIFFVMIFLFSFYHNRKQKKIGLKFLLMLINITMVISYHRLHDLLFAVPVMISILFCLWERREYLQFGFLSLFMSFLIIPLSIIHNISNILGSFIEGNSYIYTVHFMQWRTIFPVISIYMFLFVSYSMYLYFFTEEVSFWEI